MPPKRFSLGAALFGSPPADEHEGPAQQAPDAFLLRLWELSTEDELSGFFQAGRASRDALLASADSATLTIDFTTVQPDQDAWSTRLTLLQQALITRGERGSTKVSIICTREQSNTPAFQQVATMLAGTGQAVDMLVFLKVPQGQNAPDSTALAGFLQTAAPGLGRLDGLSFECGPCCVPAPAVLPRLGCLRMTLEPGADPSVIVATLTSIRPYLGQLWSLAVGLPTPDAAEPDNFPWHTLFPPTTVAAAAAAAPTTTATAAAAAAATAPTTTAPSAAAGTSAAQPTPPASTSAAAAATASTSIAAAGTAATPAAAASTAATVAAAAAAPKLLAFSTSYDLTDALLTTLLHHAPNLKEINTWCLAIRQDHSGREWGLRMLNVWEGMWDSGMERLYEGVYMPTLVRLPVCNHGEPVLVGGSEKLKLFATSAQGLDQAVSDRLRDFDFCLSDIDICPAHTLAEADQPTAFRNMLIQLQALKAPDAVVATRGWHWTVDMLSIAAECVPLLTNVQVQVYASCESSLTDEHLQHILQLPDQSFVGVFHGLSITDQHSDDQWPFYGLMFMDTVNVADLVKLPRPDEASEGILWCRKLVIDEGSITEVGTERLCEWLQHVKWSHADMSAEQDQPMTITLECIQNDLDMQRATLQVLRAMQLDSSPNVQNRVTIVLDGWQLRHAAMDALRECLPEWAAQLDLSRATFPLQASEYTLFAQCVPVSYTAWYTALVFDSPAFGALTQGINARRQGLGLGRLILTVRGGAAGGWVHVVEEHYTVHSAVDPGSEDNVFEELE